MSEMEIKDNITTKPVVYKLDPLKHGFEPISKYPELEHIFGSDDSNYVKIICYSDINNLVYWYTVITNGVGFRGDDRIKIYNSTYNFGNSPDAIAQSTPSVVYMGLVSNDEFAETLLKHLFGTTVNDSLKDVSIERYDETVGEVMRSEYPQYYNL